MCRLLAAIGESVPVRADAVLAAAAAMAPGNAAHERPELTHRAGWGLAAFTGAAGAADRLLIHRSARAIDEDPDAAGLGGLVASIVLVHLRNSSFNGLAGLEYAHPQTHRTASAAWHVMHNGSMPGLAAVLGPSASYFDTANYARFIAPPRGMRLEAAAALSAIASVPETTAANALIFNDDFLYIVNAYPADSPHPRFYTMVTADHNGVRYFASEPSPALAPAAAWRPLANPSIREFRVDHCFQSGGTPHAA